MEKIKISWFAKLLFGKYCLIPGYSKHLEFYQKQAEYNQRREDRFVESEIERLAQEQYQSYLCETEKWKEFAKTLKNPELNVLFWPLVYERRYPRCYRISDEATARFKNVNINAKIQHRYNELLSLNQSIPHDPH